MTKYGRQLHFGYRPIPTAADPKRLLQLAALAETLGLKYVGIQNYSGNADHLEPWTLLTAIGMETSNVSLFAHITDLHLRPPAMLAKAAASLDQLTGGRVEIALDADAFVESQMGGGNEQRSDNGAPAALEEAVQVMRFMWGMERSGHFEGNYQQLAGLQPGPAPSRPISIWLSGNEPHSLELAGRVADGWIADSYLLIQSSNLARLNQQVDDAATAAGRDSSAVQRILNVTGSIGKGEGSTPFQGSAKQWAEQLAELAIEVGIDTFLLMEGADAETQLRKFALEVVPHARELVDQASEVSPGLEWAHQGSGASGATPAEEETCDVDLVDETSMESFPASDPPASSSFT